LGIRPVFEKVTNKDFAPYCLTRGVFSFYRLLLADEGACWPT